MKLPRFMLRHEVTIEPYLGETSKGASYGTGVTVRCLRDDKRRLIRTTDGQEVISSITLYCPPGTTAPAQSRITFDDDATAVVLDSSDRDGAGLPTPDHVELACQ